MKAGFLSHFIIKQYVINIIKMAEYQLKLIIFENIYLHSCNKLYLKYEKKKNEFLSLIVDK